MSIRGQIEHTFQGKAFKRPLFYSYEGGLRLELSEGGSFLNQFLTAHRKGMEVCSQVFSGCKEITVCMKICGGKKLLSSLSTLTLLRDIELYPKSAKEHWTEFDEMWRDDEYFEDSLWHYIVFNAPIECLTPALWCACANGPIKPRAGADVYLFSLERGVVVLPYDDRGMDIVGPNKRLLKELYDTFGHYLLDYDRAAMDATFGEMP